MKTYELDFLEDALKEWKKLNSTVRDQFAKMLDERLAAPRVPSARLSDFPDCYKIKLRKAGYRLVYRVDDGRIVIIVIAIGHRAYKAAARQME